MSSLTELLERFHVLSSIQAVLLIIAGYFIARIVSKAAVKLFQKKLTNHRIMVFRRIVFYAVFLLFLTSAIQQLGFTITALLGATGIITVAIGIASQTSMSNIISGLFIIGEKPFEIGDTIKVNDLQGEVISIDYLSVKIRTTENTMVRIPNETLIKSPIVNISYFPNRRADFTYTFPFKTDLEKLKTAFETIVGNNKHCLNDPMPTMTIIGLTDSGLKVQFSIWAKKDKFNDLKNSIPAEINAALEKDNLSVSHSSQLFTIQANSPLPIQLIEPK